MGGGGDGGGAEVWIVVWGGGSDVVIVNWLGSLFLLKPALDLGFQASAPS